MKVTLAITIVVSSLAFIKGHQIEQHTNNIKEDATNSRRRAQKVASDSAAKAEAKSSKAKSVKSEKVADAKAEKQVRDF